MDFWQAVLAVCRSSKIPEIGKVVGPGVAAGDGMVIDEFEPLLGALRDPTDSVREAAESALAHSVRALLAERGVGPDSYGLLLRFGGTAARWGEDRNRLSCLLDSVEANGQGRYLTF